MKEDQIIEFLKKKFPQSIGDDGVSLKPLKNSLYVITKDLLIEDTHFRKRYFTAMDLAHKALNVNLSDLAAMGARSKYILLGLSIPKNDESYINEFLKKFSFLCKKSDIQLIGGDTTESKNKLFISITAFGEAKNQFLKFRHSAKNSNKICVAGSLGYAHIGFKLLEKNKKGFHFFKQSLKRPRAKTSEGLWLGKRKEVTAMMDLSDGLYVDLLRMCKASKLMAKINLNGLKKMIQPRFKLACEKLILDPLETMLTGGEDYGLLFTVQEKSLQRLKKDFFSHFQYKMKYIGEMKKGEGVTFTQNGLKKILKLKCFSHFE